jgi:hypothetical protein
MPLNCGRAVVPYRSLDTSMVDKRNNRAIDESLLRTLKTHLFPFLWTTDLSSQLFSTIYTKTTMSDPCIAINGAGVAYREFSCDYPQLGKFYFE